MKKLLLAVSLIVTVLMTNSVAKENTGDIHIYTVNMKGVTFTPLMMEDAFRAANFSIGINSDVEMALGKVFNLNNYKIYSSLSLFHNEDSIALINDVADAGVLLPMGVAMYQANGSDVMRVAVLRKEAQAKLIGKNSKYLDSLEKKVLGVITSLLPTAKHSFNDESLDETRKLLTRYELDLKGADWEDAKDTLEEEFEEGFEEEGFVMPSYFDHMEMLGEDSPYDFYTTYSICKLAVIAAISTVKPEAASFAPCTTMIYKKKNEDKIVMGFTSVYNWLSSAKISDKPAVDLLMTSQVEFEAVVKKVTGN